METQTGERYLGIFTGWEWGEVVALEVPQGVTRKGSYTTTHTHTEIESLHMHSQTDRPHGPTSTPATSQTEKVQSTTSNPNSSFRKWPSPHCTPQQNHTPHIWVQPEQNQKKYGMQEAIGSKQLSRGFCTHNQHTQSHSHTVIVIGQTCHMGQMPWLMPLRLLAANENRTEPREWVSRFYIQRGDGMLHGFECASHIHVCMYYVLTHTHTHTHTHTYSSWQLQISSMRKALSWREA